MRRLYVKTPARNYTLFQNIFVVETFFSTRKFLKCLLKNYWTFWKNQKFKKSIFGKKLTVSDRKYRKKAFFFFKNLCHKNIKIYTNFWLKIWAREFGLKNLAQKMCHYKSVNFQYEILIKKNFSTDFWGFFLQFFSIFLDFRQFLRWSWL